ncbi:UPF0603 protein [Proteiniborus sp. DW1]|uniref:TPM domain-containing protein n=1 Tax=Proteiniborus sp. DW1 TaxID=1889883 RepID=UPI00092DEEDB|nr:TPM domain-containing protein [Proteiniborus sp. DW1]SCG81658.1 UPF0603 protein [Proteiniborus sp. DW1]
MRKELKTITIITMVLIILIGVNVYAIDQKIYDEADLFTQTEEDALQAKAFELSERLNLDTVILTIQDSKGKSSRAYADDFYDENGFGYGESYDGLILLINMDDREVYISTCGKAIDYFTDARIESILDKVYIYLTEGNYSLGAEAFLTEVEYYFQKGIPSNQYTYDEDTGISSKGNAEVFQKKDLASRLLIFFLISIGVGGISVGIMAINNKGRVSTNQGTYLDRNSFNLINSQDRHVNTRVTFVNINTESKSSAGKAGRSTVHRSSSGRSHGGGGRKF